MKLDEILNETVTFSPMKYDEKTGEYDHFTKKSTQECWMCDGYGVEQYFDKEKNKYYDPSDLDGYGDVSKFEAIECRLCRGEGKILDEVPTGPELNVANRNATVILKMIGIEPDYAGEIPKDKLADIRRTLIKIKNQGVDKFTIEPKHEPSKLIGRDVVDDDGIKKIQPRYGAGIMDLGLSPEQIERYIDVLIDMIDFAQKNNATIGWG